MRMIGHLDDAAKAQNFGDYLYVQGIDNQIEAEKDGSYLVWIHREEDMERGRALLTNYQANPNDARFQNNAQAAEQLREQKRREQQAYENRLKERRHLFRPMAAYGFGPVTMVLIVVSVIVFLISKFGYDFRPVYGLFISLQDIAGLRQESLWSGFLARISQFHDVLPEVRHGEVWRLITPMFIHFGFLHIFFNLLWLRDLGSMIEARLSSVYLLIQVVCFAAISNFAQYMVHGPAFGGMSGVVYGLFGFVWIRGKFDPGSGLFLHPTTVTMMLIWLVVCMIGIMGAIANTAHTVGLLMGVAWGYLSSLRHR